MPHKTWTRERLTAAQLQDYLQDQAVLQFASASARDAALPTAARKVGMIAHAADTGIYWGWNGTTWQPVAQLGGSLVGLTVNVGWNGSPANPPWVYRSGPNRARLIGHHTNVGVFTPNGTQYPVTVPAGYRAATSQVVTVPYIAAGAGPGLILATVLTDGRLRYDAVITGPTSIAASSTFFLDSVEWHTTYPA